MTFFPTAARSRSCPVFTGHRSTPGLVAASGVDPAEPGWAFQLLTAPCVRIASGTDEIQRNILGEQVLGLSKEPQVDRDQPFRDVVRAVGRAH